MLSNEAIKSFAFLEIAAEQTIKGWDINNLPTASEIQARAEQRASEYLLKLSPTIVDDESELEPETSEGRYADFCFYIKNVIEMIHAHKMRGIGKLATTKRLAAEDPAQFQAFCQRLEAEDLKEMRDEE